VFQDLFALPQNEKNARGAERHAVAAEQNSHFLVKGTVFDPSGAAIAGATVRVQRTKGAIDRTTRTDAFGSFSITGLSEGQYRGEISKAGFEIKKFTTSLGPTQMQGPLSFALTVAPVNTAISVQGREDDLVGVAELGTRGTVGAKPGRVSQEVSEVGE
jgi:hypothetical protein